MFSLVAAAVVVDGGGRLAGVYIKGPAEDDPYYLTSRANDK